MSSANPSSAVPVCPVCKSRAALFLCKVDGYDVWRCPESATDFVWPMPSPAVLKELYDREAWFQGGERGGYSDYDAQTEPSLHLVQELLGRFPDDGQTRTVLDVGCGYGSHLKIAQERGWACLGIEPSAHARDVCEQRHGDQITVVERAEDLLPVRCDLVLMFEVIEHLQDPYSVFFTLFGRGIIGPDTLVVITTPNARSLDAMGDPAAWAYRHPPSHLVFFSAEALRQLLQRLLFKDIQVRGIVPVSSKFDARYPDEAHAANAEATGYLGVMAEARGSDFKEFMHERYVPGAFWKLTEYEHFPRYNLAAQLAQGAKVLDFGCGTGYGSAKLSQVAASVTGLDISEEAIHWARSTHRLPGLEFTVRSDLGQGLPAASFDLVTCFEMIEHVDHATQIATVQSIARLLKPEGKLVMSTPDPKFTAPYGDNPYHIREMNEAEFTELLSAGFKYVTMLKQWVRPSVAIAADTLMGGQSMQVDALSPSESPDTPVGFVAICSNTPFDPPPPLCLFETAVDFNWETLETEHKLNRLRFKNHQWAAKARELQRQNAETEAAKQWNAEQSRSWQSLAEQREETIVSQRGQLQELGEAQAWMQGQRDAWQQKSEQAHDALQQSQAELEQTQTVLQQTQVQLNDSQTELARLRGTKLLRALNWLSRGRLFNPGP